MAFHTPITIKEALDNIHRHRYALPAIQRELVWSQRQITRLFDSLMRGYPIGAFLFWRVESENLKQYQFYDFMLITITRNTGTIWNRLVDPQARKNS